MQPRAEILPTRGTVGVLPRVRSNSDRTRISRESGRSKVSSGADRSAQCVLIRRCAKAISREVTMKRESARCQHSEVREPLERSADCSEPRTPARIQGRNSVHKRLWPK